MTEEHIVTTVRLRRDQWAYLRRAAEDLAVTEGGRADSSEALRHLLDSVMFDELNAPPTPSAPPPPTSAAEDASDMKAAEFRRIRRNLGLKQSEMAKRLRVNVGTISRWERGAVIKGSVALGVRMLARSGHQD